MQTLNHQSNYSFSVQLCKLLGYPLYHTPEAFCTPHELDQPGQPEYMSSSALQL
uniref:Uncharacterized protein n=1 Tax=Arundo donax TaxID=35708 RepID=A0A0A9DPN3_ARUDO